MTVAEFLCSVSLGSGSWTPGPGQACSSCSGVCADVSATRTGVLVCLVPFPLTSFPRETSPPRHWLLLLLLLEPAPFTALSIAASATQLLVHWSPFRGDCSIEAQFPAGRGAHRVQGQVACSPGPCGPCLAGGGWACRSLVSRPSALLRGPGWARGRGTRRFLLTHALPHGAGGEDGLREEEAASRPESFPECF